MIAAANRDGYAAATVTAVIAEAGVSRPTFYEHFKDRDDCFMATLEAEQRQQLERTKDAIARANPEDAATAAITALIEHARNDPAAAQFLTSEPLAATTLALDARDEHLKGTAALVDRAARAAAPKASIPDLPATIMLGAASRMLGTRLRRGEPSLTSLHTELLDWAGRYARPHGQQRWQTLKAGPVPASKPPNMQPLLIEPAPLPRGRQQLGSEEVAINHRQRILHAVAKLAQAKGYDATTIADIAKNAKVDQKAFYRVFTDKQGAFMNYHELAFQALMATMSSAFFEGDDWPDRAWHSGDAFLKYLAAEPLVAHIGFIEAYAVGPMAIQRVEDSHVAFTIFLQEGYQYAQKNGGLVEPPGRVTLEAIVTAIYELVYLQVRAGKTKQLPRQLGLMGALVLTPFVGAAESDRLIDG